MIWDPLLMWAMGLLTLACTPSGGDILSRMESSRILKLLSEKRIRTAYLHTDMMQFSDMVRHSPRSKFWFNGEPVLLERPLPSKAAINGQ